MADNEAGRVLLLDCVFAEPAREADWNPDFGIGSHHPPTLCSAHLAHNSVIAFAAIGIDCTTLYGIVNSFFYAGCTIVLRDADSS